MTLCYTVVNESMIYNWVLVQAWSALRRATVGLGGPPALTPVKTKFAYFVFTLFEMDSTKVWRTFLSSTFCFMKWDPTAVTS